MSLETLSHPHHATHFLAHQAILIQLIRSCTLYLLLRRAEFVKVTPTANFLWLSGIMGYSKTVVVCKSQLHIANCNFTGTKVVASVDSATFSYPTIRHSECEILLSASCRYTRCQCSKLRWNALGSTNG